MILKEHGKAVPAIEAFEHALALDPNLSSALWNLSDLLFARGSDLDRSDEMLVRALGHGLPEGPKLVIGRAIGYQRSGQADRSLALVNAALRGAARTRRSSGCFAAATASTRRSAPAPPPTSRRPSVSRRRMRRRMRRKASRGCAPATSAPPRRAFTRSLEIDPNQPKVREFLQSLGRTP